MYELRARSLAINRVCVCVFCMDEPMKIHAYIHRMNLKLDSITCKNHFLTMKIGYCMDCSVCGCRG